MRFRDHYDWIVLGDHPGALLSAAMAARQGLSVLILDLDRSEGNVGAKGVSGTRGFSRKGPLLEFSSNFYIGLGGIEGTRGLFSECLSMLDIPPEQWAEQIREDEAIQIITPDLRIRSTPEPSGLLRELRRELGDPVMASLGLPGAVAAARQPVSSFWNRLSGELGPAQLSQRTRRPDEPLSDIELKNVLKKTASHLKKEERHWLQSRRWDAGLPGNFPAKELQEAFRGLWYGTLGQEPAAAMNAVDLVYMLVLSQSAASFKGGVQSLKTFLRDIARKQGAHVAKESVCRRIFIEDGAIRGIQASEHGKSHGSMITTKGAVLGIALDHAREHVSASNEKWQRQMKKSPRPDSWRFTVSVKVHAEAIPPGVSRRMIWSEAGAPPLEVEIADPKDYGHYEEKDRRILFLRTQLPFTQESLEVSYQRLITGRMLRQLMELMPFIEYHIIEIYPDFRKGTHEFTEVYGYATPVMIPEHLRTITRNSCGFRTGVEGLFLATEESYPLLGSLGPVVAALESTAWATRKSSARLER